MNEQQKIVNWLQSTEIPISSISENTGISRQTLYKWMQATVPIKIHKNKLKAIYKVYVGDIEKEENMSYTIDAQKETIKLLKEKVEKLEVDLSKHEESPFQSSVWNDLQFHLYSEVVLTFNFPSIVGRKMILLTGRKYIKQFLGYNDREIDSYWQINKHYKDFNKHPINNILSGKSKDTIIEKVKTLPAVFESLKHMVGNHYIPVPITFKCKNGEFLHTIAYNKIDWSNKKVQTKTEFILGQ